MADIDAADFALLRKWFEDLSGFVNAGDFVSGRTLMSEDLVIFGTYADILVGRDNAENNQWRNVWTKISGFKGRLDDMHGFTSPDRLFAVGVYAWDSTGYNQDGTPFDRPGRA